MNDTGKTDSGVVKWRNRKTGTVYASVEFNGTPVATVTTEAGSVYNVDVVSLDAFTEPTSNTELDAQVEDWAKSIGFGVVHIPKKGAQWLNPALSGRYDIADLRFWYEHVGSPKPYSRPEPNKELWSSAMSIVNPILDLANIDVVKRQEINDQCDDIAMAVIAQREQAAELRGRIDELDKTTEMWIHNQHEDDFSDYLQRRKATLQATKPEKEQDETNGLQRSTPRQDA